MTTTLQVTICALEQVIARLKLCDVFSFDQAEINESWGQWDVLFDVEDLDELEPADEGHARAFLAWTRAAAEGAFDEGGFLRQPLPMRWGGSRASLQMAFAESGLTVRIETDEEGHPAFGESGRLVLGPESATTDCDLRVVLRAFERLGERGVVALGNAGYTASDGWTDVAGASDGARPTAAFWTEQQHDAFDEVGNLASPLWLFWRGDAEAIAATLREAGLTVLAPAAAHEGIEISAGPCAPIALASFAEAAAAGPSDSSPRASASPRVFAPTAGPLRLVGSFRGGDIQPVVRLALDPRRPSRLALAQALDAHDFPAAPAYLVDLGGDAAPLPLSDKRAMGVGGMRLLGDGRLYLCTTELRKLDADDVYGTSCLVLYGPEGEILVQGFSHISEAALLSFDDAERFAVLGQPDGALVYEIPVAGAPWPEGRALRLPDPGLRAAYTRSAISADAASVIWCDDWAHPLACFDRGTGALRWRHAAKSERRFQLRFTPDSSAVGLIVGNERPSRQLRVVSTSTGEAVAPDLGEATRGLFCFAFHAAGRVVAIGEARGRVSFVDRGTGARLGSVAVFSKGEVTALEFDAAGEHLAVGGSKGDVALFQFRELFDGLEEPASEPAPPAPLFAGRAKGHPLIGAVGRVADPLHGDASATVLAISPNGAKLRVRTKILGRDMDLVIMARQFWNQSDPTPISASCPFEPGDTVFAHAGRWAGQRLCVEGVDEAGRRAFVSRDDKLVAASFDDITLAGPLRRDPLEDYRAVLERHRFGFGLQRPLTEHCVELLRPVDWDAEHPDLGTDSPAAAEHEALEARVRDRAQREHEARLGRLSDRFEPLDREARAARWQGEWEHWIGRDVAVEPLPELEGLGDDTAAKWRAVWALRERFEREPWS